MSVWVLSLGDLDDNDTPCIGPFTREVDAEQWAAARGWPDNRYSLIFVIEPDDIRPNEFVYKPKED